MYKLLTVKGMFDEEQHIIRNDGNGSFTSFPVDESNRDYKEYLRWVAAGNTPEPADEA
jgi:hypothetical protein